MNKQTENKIIDLLSDVLKDAVKKTNHHFSDEDLFIIANTCSHDLEKRNLLFEEISQSATKEIANYAKLCKETYENYYDDFKKLRKNEFYQVVINWPDSNGNYNIDISSKEVHTEKYNASSFEDVTKIIENFYRSAHLGGNSRRTKANYSVERYMSANGRDNLPVEKWVKKEGGVSSVFYDENKRPVDINISDRNFKFPFCIINGKKFSPHEYLVKFPNFVKDGDLLVADNPEFIKYFVAYNNKEDLIDKVRLVDVEDGRIYTFHPSFLALTSFENLPENLKNNYNEIIKKIKETNR